jgi:hypothetical protein
MENQTPEPLCSPWGWGWPGQLGSSSFGNQLLHRHMVWVSCRYPYLGSGWAQVATGGNLISVCADKAVGAYDSVAALKLERG